MKYIVSLLISTLIIATSYSQQTSFQKKFPLVDRYIDTLMNDWNIPGLAIGIVYRDQLVYAKGYGFRDVEKRLPVTTQTIFPIASNTKLFTATAACMLALEGKLDIDRPARNYLPDLRFSTDELSSKVTVRDMLSHRTGLPSYDGIWVASDLSRKDLLKKIPAMKSQLGFREGYIYNNMMYTAAGLVMEAVTGERWEDIIRKKLLERLQMNSTGFWIKNASTEGDIAYSYFESDSSGKLKRSTFVDQSEALGPAGTIKSNVEDMSKWMIAQLNNGKFKGLQVIPESVIRQTLVPNSIADRRGRWDELSNSLYALGRSIQTYKGKKITSHTGSIDGFYSNLTFLQGDSLAIFIIHNGAAGGGVRSIMTLPVLDILLNLGTTPWNQRFRSSFLANKLVEARVQDSLEKTQVKQTLPSHPLASYTGTYTSEVYGDVKISNVNEQLIFTFRGQNSKLYHFHYDQFQTREHPFELSNFRLHFLTSKNGTIDKFTMEPYGDPEAEFVKK